VIVVVDDRFLAGSPWCWCSFPGSGDVHQRGNYLVAHKRPMIGKTSIKKTVLRGQRGLPLGRPRLAWWWGWRFIARRVAATTIGARERRDMVFMTTPGPSPSSPTPEPKENQGRSPKWGRPDPAHSVAGMVCLSLPAGSSSSSVLVQTNPQGNSSNYSLQGFTLNKMGTPLQSTRALNRTAF